MTHHYIPESDLAKNLNGEFGLTLELQRMLACENTQFMIELSRELKLSYTIPSLSLQIATLFFQRRSYIHFDRLLILTASLLLASKLRNHDCRLKSLCNSFYNVVIHRTHSTEPFNEDKMKKLKEYISIYETEILRALEFDIDVITPHQFVKKECDLLYISDKDIYKRVYNCTRVLIMDSYRSRCCLVFPPIVIFVACFLIANRYEAKKPYNNPAVRAVCKSQNPSQQNLYDTWLKMISARQCVQVPAISVRDCLKMVNSVLLIY